MRSVMADREEVVQVVGRLETLSEELAVRGLRTAGPEHFSSLDVIREELERVNAEHLADRVEALATATRNDDRGAAAALLRLRASLRLFERMLTQEVVAEVLESTLVGEGEEVP
jgi:hypothetical protein